MPFELDDTFIDEILFYMENQDGEFLLDTRECKVINLFYDMIEEKNNEYENDDRYISLPEWRSADGFRLMEKFVASLKNPLIRNELSAALNKSRGVFRAFRDALNQYPETEKQWYNFKEKEMKNEVILWYNALREEWKLKPIGFEPEDHSSLVYEDFVILETDNAEKSAFSFKAETTNGDFAGIISASINNTIVHVNNLEVQPEFRGMGIGKTLLSKMLEKANEQKLDVTLDLPVEANFFSRSLLLENFKPLMQRFIRHFEAQ